MKVRKLIKEYYRAIIKGRTKKQRRLYDKITKKSLDRKHTEAVQ